MQVSTKQFYQNQVDQMATLQKAQNDIQEKITTGKEVSKPSDDLVAFSHASQLLFQQSQLTQYNKNMTGASSVMKSEDNALTQSAVIVTRIQELCVQGSSDTYSAADRKTLATEMSQLKQQLMDLANSKDVNGDYIFSGSKSSTQPFSADSAGVVAYNGDTNHRMVEISQGSQIAVGSTGAEVFMHVAGNTSTPNSSIFDSIDSAISKLNAGQSVSANVSDMKLALDQITNYQASNGARLSRVDLEQQNNQTTQLNNKTALSSFQDADVSALIIELTQKSTTLQASQSAFIKITGQSLFNYLR